MSGLGAFVVGAAVGAAVATHHKNKHKDRHHHHVQHVAGPVVVNPHSVHTVPNQTQVVYVSNHPLPPAARLPPPLHHHHHHQQQHHRPPAQSKGHHHGPSHGYHGYPTSPSPHHPPSGGQYPGVPNNPGYGAPIGFVCTQTISAHTAPGPSTPYPPQPYPQSPAHAQPFERPGQPLPISPAAFDAYPTHPSGFPPNPPYPGAQQSPGYLSPPYPASAQPGGYPPTLPYPPLNVSHGTGASLPYPSCGPPQPVHQQVQAQVTVQLTTSPANIGTETTGSGINPYRRYFFLINADTRSALQISSSAAGSKLVMQLKQSTGNGDQQRTSQLWYFDNDGILRSKVNDFAVEARDGGTWLCVAPHSGGPEHQWVLREGRILSNRTNPGDCICLEDGLMGTPVNADVIVSRYLGKMNHQWIVEYL